MNTYGCIYRIKNRLNGKSYIGKTVNTAEDRLRNHIRLSNNGSDTLLHRAMRKYGSENFVTEILFQPFNHRDLNYFEKMFIQMYDCCSLDGNEKGYNMTRGGDGIDSELATRINEERIATGRHNFTTDEFKAQVSIKQQSLLDLNQHPLQGERGSAIQRRRIENGTHNLSGVSGSKLQKSLVAAGKHPLAGQRGSELQKRKMNEGTHEFVKSHVCPKCGKAGKGPGMFRYHFDRCKSSS